MINYLDNLVNEANCNGPLVAADRCTKAWHQSSSCSLCLDNCPRQAIKFNRQTVQIESSKCNCCGICSSICPTGVFELEGLCYGQIVKKVKQLALSSKQLQFRCSQKKLNDEKDNQFIALPCLAAIDEILLLSPFLFGIEIVYLNTSNCSDCEIAQGLETIENKADSLNKLLKLFSNKGMICTSGLSWSKSIDRSNKGNKPNPSEFNQLLQKEIFRKVYQKQSENLEFEDQKPIQARSAKREMLLAILRQLGELPTGKISVSTFPFTDLEVSNQCMGCQVCAQFCPTGALAATNGNYFTLNFTPAFCVKCRLCLDLCPVKALSFSDEINFLDFISQHSAELVHYQQQTCKYCEKPLNHSKGLVCIECQKQIFLQNS
jgi:ferredoxin